MRILLANKFYYRRGGDCIFTMNLENLLKSKGHEVAIFSMKYPDNEPSEWMKYWPKTMTKFAAFTRPFGDREVKRKYSQFLDDFAPDVVHLNNIHTQLSPILAEIAHERGIKVVWTLHDTKLVCPCYTCMRNGIWCTECFTDKKSVVRHRCMPGNLPGAIVGWREIVKWNKERLERCVDLFLPPSQFMKDIVVAGGYSASKMEVLCNFIDVEKVKNPSLVKDDYYIYLGRVNAVKGVRTLCQAASGLPYKLIIIGEGELLEELRSMYSGIIEFVGHKNWQEIRPLLEGAKFMVLPAEWSENNPLTIIESQSLGTPVLGARIGGIPELIEEEVNGMTFSSGDVNDLKEKIQKMWSASFNYRNIAESSVAKFSSEAYYERLMTIYNGK